MCSILLPLVDMYILMCLRNKMISLGFKGKMCDKASVCNLSSVFSLPVGLPFFILTPQHSPFKRGFFCNDESIRYPLKEDSISYQLLGGVMIPFTLIAASKHCVLLPYRRPLTVLFVISGSQLFARITVSYECLLYIDHLWRVPFCLHVSGKEPIFGDRLCCVRLQSRGKLRVWSCGQPVSDGRSQVLHRPSASALLGRVQTSLGPDQLQGRGLRRELHLHWRQVPGGWGEVMRL